MIALTPEGREERDIAQWKRGLINRDAQKRVKSGDERDTRQLATISDRPVCDWRSLLPRDGNPVRRVQKQRLIGTKDPQEIEVQKRSVRAWNPAKSLAVHDDAHEQHAKKSSTMRAK